MDILNGILFGLISGLSEFLPISAAAHRKLFAMAAGMDNTATAVLLAHAGSLLALLIFYRQQLKHMRREMRIAGSSRKRKLRNPDLAAVSTVRVVLTATVPMVLGLLASKRLQEAAAPLWATAALLICNGILLYIPQFTASGNKNSLSMRPLDGVLYGFCSALSSVPGISSVACTLLTGHRRGLERAYIVDLSMFLMIPWLLGSLVLDLLALFTVSSFSFLAMVCAILGAAAAFAGSYGAIALLRYLAVRIGFHGFAYYSWGAGFVCLILYLMI